MPTSILSRVMCPVHVGVSILICSLTFFFGWMLDISFHAGIYGTVKLTTVIGFILLSSCLIDASKYKSIPLLFLSIKILIVLYFCVSLLEDYFNWKTGIDEFFFSDVQEAPQVNNNGVKASPMTALLFIMISVGLIGVLYIKKYVAAFQYLFHIVTFISFIIIVGYLFKIPALYSFYFRTFTSFYTTFIFFFLSIGASLLSPSTGLTAIFTVHNIGNIIARRLFLQMMFTIVVITYIRFEVHAYNFINSDFCIGLMVIAFVMSSLFFTLKASKSLNDAEQRRNIAEERFKLVVESAPNALIMSDSEGKITLLNVRAENLFGYSREEMIGQKIETLIPKKFRKHHPSNRNSYHETPVSRYFGAGAELHAVNKNGVEFPVEIGLNPIKNSNETAVLASIIDITDRKKQELQIKQQLIELKLKNREMEQFSYIASHDLQEPLRTVSNYIMLLKEDYPELDEEIITHLGVMESAICRMSMLVKYMLDYGRLGSDKKLSLTNCNSCVSNVLADLNTLIVQNNATVIVENNLPEINAYEIEFRQLIQNLINNAIKFKKENTAPFIKIGCRQTDGDFEFYLTDNGIGIDKKYSKRIFQIFQRLHSRHEFEGHGIGLANCKKIVEMHGGKIWVESIPDQGSTFNFTISKL